MEYIAVFNFDLEKQKQNQKQNKQDNSEGVKQEREHRSGFRICFALEKITEGYEESKMAPSLEFSSKKEWEQLVTNKLLNIAQKEEVMIFCGYTFWEKGGLVLAEVSMSFAGNTVIIFHDYDNEESTLYIKSRRHGIPSLADPFRGREPIRDTLYNSERSDRGWEEKGLSLPPEERFYDLVGLEGF